MQLVLSALQTGAVYALVGLGFYVIMQSTSIVNFAQGEFVMLGALVLVVASSTWGLPYPLAVLVALITVGVLAFLIQVGLLARLYGRGRDSLLMMVLVLLAMLTVLRQGAKLIFGAQHRAAPTPVPRDPIPVLGGEFFLRPQGLLLIGVTAAVFVLIVLFYRRTNIGKIIRAVGVDRRVAEVIGIDVRRIDRIAFFAGGGIAALAGVLFAGLTSASYQMGTPLTIKGFVALVLGGASHATGALLGGIVLAGLEVFAAQYISSMAASMISLGILLFILLVRPSGLLGEVTGQR